MVNVRGNPTILMIMNWKTNTHIFDDTVPLDHFGMEII